MNQVAFHLGEPIYWYLAQQEQIEALLETSHLQIEDADIFATDRIHHLFEEAVSRRGSDIHLESEKNQLRVRFRIDGYLQDSAPMPMSFQPLIFSRIKLLAEWTSLSGAVLKTDTTHTTPTVISFLTLEFPLCRVNLGKNGAAAVGSDTGTTQIGSNRFFQK